MHAQVGDVIRGTELDLANAAGAHCGPQGADKKVSGDPPTVDELLVLVDDGASSLVMASRGGLLATDWLRWLYHGQTEQLPELIGHLRVPSHDFLWRARAVPA